MASVNLDQLVQRYSNNSESVYHTWFNSEARRDALQSIPSSVCNVVLSIKNGSFGNDFKGSPLETVLNSITEQKQVFKGAAHPFYWKPKLGIPDIYENEQNKRHFAQFLECCLSEASGDDLVKEINKLDEYKIKGLGPAVANILYFLHPTKMSPFNTAMVKGYNLIFPENIKLGCWQSYLKMRETIIKSNERLQPSLSEDLGAISGLLYDVGVEKISLDTN